MASNQQQFYGTWGPQQQAQSVYSQQPMQQQQYYYPEQNSTWDAQETNYGKQTVEESDSMAADAGSVVYANSHELQASNDFVASDSQARRNAIRHTDSLISRVFVVNFEGSLANMATKPSYREWTPQNLDIFKTRTRYEKDAIRSDKPQGDVENAILHEMVIESYDNKYPVAMAIKGSGWGTHVRGNYRDKANGQYLFVFPAGHKEGNLQKTIVTESKFANSEYLEQYPNFSTGHIGTRGVIDPSQWNMKKSGGDANDFLYVDVDHPMVELLLATEIMDIPSDLTHDQVQSMVMDEQWLKMERSLFDEGKALLKEDLKNIPSVNFRKSGFELCRVGYKMNSTTGVTSDLEDINSEDNAVLRREALRTEGSLMALIRIKFRYF